MDLIFEVADSTAMKRNNAKMYPANARLAVPSVCADGQNDFLVAEILNALCELL